MLYNVNPEDCCHSCRRLLQQSQRYKKESLTEESIDKIYSKVESMFIEILKITRRYEALKYLKDLNDVEEEKMTQLEISQWATSYDLLKLCAVFCDFIDGIPDEKLFVPDDLVEEIGEYRNNMQF